MACLIPIRAFSRCARISTPSTFTSPPSKNDRAILELRPYMDIFYRLYYCSAPFRGYLKYIVYRFDN